MELQTKTNAIRNNLSFLILIPLGHLPIIHVHRHSDQFMDKGEYGEARYETCCLQVNALRLHAICVPQQTKGIKLGLF